MDWCCLIVLVCYMGIISRSYFAVSNVLDDFRDKVVMLEEVINYDVVHTFVNDKNLFDNVTRIYLENRYERLLKLFRNNVGRLKVHSVAINKYLNDCNSLSIIIASLPLLLNLSWWTNLIKIVAIFMNIALYKGETADSG